MVAPRVVLEEVTGVWVRLRLALRSVSCLTGDARAQIALAEQRLSSMRRALAVRPADPIDPGQLVLELPLPSDALVFDCPLGCPVSALVCTARQIQSEQEIGAGARAKRRSSPAKRGRTPTRPACVTTRCSLGASVRERHGDTAEARAMASRAPRATDTSET